MCLKRCCGMFTVKTGSLILLWITVIVWSIGVISVIYEIISDLMTSSSEQISNPEQAKASNSYSPQVTGPSVGTSSAAFCLNSIVLAAAVSGLFAIEKRKPTFLIPYFLYRIFWAFLFCFLFIPLIFIEGYFTVQVDKIPGLLDNLGQYVKSYVDMAEEAIVLVIAIEILIIAFEVHCTIVVYQCYRQMEIEETLEKRPIPLTATWSATDKASVRLS